MKLKYFIKILLAIFFVFASTQSFAKTIKWSMQGDSLTLDPHAQNEGPTTQVSRQVYEALVTRGGARHTYYVFYFVKVAKNKNLKINAAKKNSKYIMIN